MSPVHNHKTMNPGNCLAGGFAAALLLLLTVNAWAGQKPAAPCCFTNPAYTGVCAVQPGEKETCKSILAYLNNPNSTGKLYCGGTTIRGGWKEAKCPPAKKQK
jgi:hypothetical protein